MGLDLVLDKKQKILDAKVVVGVDTASMKEKIEEETAAFLQRLESEEANLMEEKQNLLSLREKLRSKLQKEIASKKRGNKKLRAEIADLKIDCEKLSISVRASRNLQNLERASKKTFKQTMKNKGYSEKAIEEIWKWYNYSTNIPEKK